MEWMLFVDDKYWGATLKPLSRWMRWKTCYKDEMSMEGVYIACSAILRLRRGP